MVAQTVGVAARMTLEVRARGASTAEQTLGRIIAAHCEEPISGLGSFSVELPFAELQAAGYGEGGSSIAAGREVAILREGEGEVFRGICENQSIEMKDGAEIVTLSGQSLALELTFLNTYRGFEVINRTMSQALGDILAGSGWTGVATGSYNNVTKRFDNMSLLAALNELAAIGGAYWRESYPPGSRQIEIKNSSGASGILGTNVPMLSPDAYQNLDLAPIKSIGKITEDTTELYNRIVPYGKTDGDETFDLFESNRSSPYTIQSKRIIRPRIVDQLVVGESALGGSSFPTDGFTGIVDTLRVEGTDRAILVLCSIESTSSTGMPVEYRFNGKALGEFLAGEYQFQGRNNRVSILIAPEIGDNKIECWYEVSGPPGDARHLFISLEHVDQHDPSTGVASANGNSTSPSVVVGGEELGLVIDRLSHASATATPGAGQTELPNVSTTGFGNIYTGRSSIEDGVSGNTTMSWTLSAAVAWNIRALSMNAAKAFYIEDATSVAAYGLRVYNLPLGSFKPLTPADRQAAANSMYDAAVNFMIDHKDPMLNIDGMKPVFAPYADGFPGDSIKIEAIGIPGPAGTLDVRGDYVIVKRTHDYDENGAREWDWKLSTTKRFARDLLALVGDLREQLEAVQQNQV